MDRTLIIAEAGVNHNGDLNLAYELIDAAASAGADIVKFQSFNAETLVTNDASKAIYQLKNTGCDESQKDMLKNLELTYDDHINLINYSKKRNIEFLSSAFDIGSIDFLHSLGLSRWKIPSGEITNLPYLRQIGSYKQQIILSTGMANLGEVESAINVLHQAGTLKCQITVLHCTTEYPAPLNEVNLKAIQTIQKAFGLPVGYSDHTKGIFIPIAAVSMGAKVIEKHLTLDCAMEGPDHRASLEPSDFALMVGNIRGLECALGDGIKRPTPSEEANLLVARKSLVAAKAINIGEIFTTENVSSKRPGSGISPMNMDLVLGRVALRSYATDDLIDW